MTLRSVAAPAEEALAVYAGDTFDHEFTWTHDGEPVSLDGWIGAASIRARRGEDVLASFTVTNRTPADGVFALTMTKSQTAALAEEHTGVAVFDVQFTHTDTRTVTPVSGSVTITADVTA